MNNYELTLILNPDLSTKFQTFKKKFEKTLTDTNFKINKLENIGRRQLAYSILNHNKGHYAIFQIEGPSEAAIQLESKLKYDASVIRHLLLRVETPSMEDSLLFMDSKEAKKSPQDEEDNQDKLESNSEEKIETASDEDQTSE
tara:strand:- start:372 stop:800 length:429 start_codon:yes stop_codon:yes gene_type:complete